MTYAIVLASVILYSLLVFRFTKAGSRTWGYSLLICVLFGIMAAVASVFLEYVWNYFLGDFISSHHSLIFIESFIGVSLIEEGTKWLCLVFIISRWKNFNFYTDGILYACGIAAGFNLVEGGIYGTLEQNPVSMILRSFTAVPVHFFFAIVMGFLFARFKLEGDRFFWFSLIIPVILHGLYDFFILQQYADLLMGAAILVLLGCLSLSVWVIHIALKADKIKLLAIEKRGEV